MNITTKYHQDALKKETAKNRDLLARTTKGQSSPYGKAKHHDGHNRNAKRGMAMSQTESAQALQAKAKNYLVSRTVNKNSHYSNRLYDSVERNDSNRLDSTEELLAGIKELDKVDISRYSALYSRSQAINTKRKYQEP